MTPDGRLDRVSYRLSDLEDDIMELRAKVKAQHNEIMTLREQLAALTGKKANSCQT